MAIPSKELERPALQTTVIGESILVSGKLEGDEDLTVRGRVEGSITLTKTLIIEPSGVVKADASVRNAIVSGVVVGNITASESVELTREGRMVGDIKAPRVIIVDGAAFRGRVDMGDAASTPRVERPARPQQTPVSAPKVLRPLPTPGRAPVPPPPPAARNVPVPPRPPAPPQAKPAEGGQKPPAPPAPPAVKPPTPPAVKPPVPAAAAAGGAPTPPGVPAVVGLGKRKVIVKRKK